MKIKNLMLFTYDFPHKKTQDFIVRLYAEGYKVTYVIGAPRKKLNIAKSKFRLSPHNVGLVHPHKLCQALGITYLRSSHESKKTIKYLISHPVDLYIVSGARILPEKVIKAANNRILNIHPGMLPEVRGLDTLLWSIHYDVPLGLSAHFISSKIDSGLFIFKEKLFLDKDDTIIEVSLRLLESQTDFLLKTLKKLKGLKMSQLKDQNAYPNPYNTKMPEKLEGKTIKMFNKWLKKFSRK